MVIVREPLHMVFYPNANDAYTAVFFNDSQTVSLLTRNLSFSTWYLSDSQRSDKQLDLPSGCLDAQLAPGAEWIACLSTNLTFDLYRASDLARVYSHPIVSNFSPTGMVPIPLHIDSAFSGPFGFMLSAYLAPLAGRSVLRLPTVFSADGRIALLASNGNSYGRDLPTLHESKLAAPLRKEAVGITAIQPGNHVLVIDPKKESTPVLVSLDTGDIISHASFSADGGSLGTNPRYARLANFDITGNTLFDLQSNKRVAAPANLALDVHEDTIALVIPDGELQFYRVGEPSPLRRIRLPDRYNSRFTCGSS